MTNEDHSLYFAGTRAFDAPDIPSWFSYEGEKRTFGEAVRSLISADTSQVAWKVPNSILDEETTVENLSQQAPSGVKFFETWDGDVYATTDSHNAVFSPDLLIQMAEGDETDPLLNIPTDSYALVNPHDFYRPLEDALENNDLGEHIFGQFRVYDRGSEVHGDIWIDSAEVDLPQADGVMKFGVQTGYDFKGNRALYANIIAQDTSCNNSIRQLADKKTRRHVSGEDNWTLDVSEYESWWDDILSKVGLVSDELSHMIQDASDIEMVFDADEDTLDGEDDGPVRLPMSLEAFYRLAGRAQGSTDIPRYLREAAVGEARERSRGDGMTVWDIHSGLTYALTHVYRGGERGALLQYNQVAKDLLYNPMEVIGAVAQRAREEVEEAQEHADGDVETDGKATSAARLKTLQEGLSDKRSTFEQREDRVRQMLQAEGE